MFGVWLRVAASTPSHRYPQRLNLSLLAFKYIYCPRSEMRSSAILAPLGHIQRKQRSCFEDVFLTKRSSSSQEERQMRQEATE